MTVKTMHIKSAKSFWFNFKTKRFG